MNALNSFFTLSLQAIVRKVDQEGLKILMRDDDAFYKGVKMLIAIALLPPEKARDGFNHVADFPHRAGLDEEVQVFLR